MSASQVNASEVFRYDFAGNDTLHYAVSIDSDLQFHELGSLAELLKIDKIKHNIEMDVDLSRVSSGPDGNAIVRLVFKRISMIMIAGDSVFVDNGENWGVVKPGSRYDIEITPRGYLVRLVSKDTTGSRQVLQMVQRFFPVMPEAAIDSGYTWADSVNFDIELPNQPLQTIFTGISYSYNGNDLNTESGLYKFDYKASGKSEGEDQIDLAGEGSIDFNNGEERLQENSGQFALSADVSLAIFGLPAGMGTTPVDIDSKIKIHLNDDK
jgi:hypothetical protein